MPHAHGQLHDTGYSCQIVSNYWMRLSRYSELLYARMPLANHGSSVASCQPDILRCRTVHAYWTVAYPGFFPRLSNFF